MNQHNSIVGLLLVSVSLYGCGREAEQSSEAQEEAAAEVTQEATIPATVAPATTNADQVSVEDIDRWKAGMEAERKAVQEAATKLAEAEDDNAKLEALHAASEMATVDAGASAAGVDVDRYRRIRNRFSNVTSQLSPIEMEMDVKQMPPQMVEQMQQARAAGAAQLEKEFPADVLEALKSRAAELRELEKTLVGERLKVATSAR